MQAKSVASLFVCYANAKFKNGDGIGMSGSVAEMCIHLIDYKGSGSHKYIPADRLSLELGLKPDSGVYGYFKMEDGSYLLQTCHDNGRLAVWSGKSEEPAEWVK